MSESVAVAEAVAEEEPLQGPDRPALVAGYWVDSFCTVVVQGMLADKENGKETARAVKIPFSVFQNPSLTEAVIRPSNKGGAKKGCASNTKWNFRPVAVAVLNSEGVKVALEEITYTESKCELKLDICPGVLLEISSELAEGVASLRVNCKKVAISGPGAVKATVNLDGEILSEEDLALFA